MLGQQLKPSVPPGDAGWQALPEIQKPFDDLERQSTDEKSVTTLAFVSSALAVMAGPAPPPMRPWAPQGEHGGVRTRHGARIIDLNASTAVAL